MRQRIKVINTTSGIMVIQKKNIENGLFTLKQGVSMVRVTTSGTREQIEKKFASRVRNAQKASSEHMRELTEMVRQNHIKTKYFAA